MTLKIDHYSRADRECIVELSLRAWAPVFEKLEPAVPGYVFQAFYPAGWQVRQAADVHDFLERESDGVLVARDAGVIVGWIGVRLHPKDSMGEIYILAVDPSSQRKGVATALMDEAMSKIRAAGMSMVMVETGGDPGHAPARAAYESIGFERWPVARYFRQIERRSGALSADDGRA